MKKITQLLSDPPEFLRDSLEILFPKHSIYNLLFFDIETTGLSAKTSSLYLIGACYFNKEKQTFQLIQYFADEYDDEPKLLKEFYDLSQNFSLLLHYNGRSFDLPYLNTKCEMCKLPFRFSRNSGVISSSNTEIEQNLSEQKVLEEIDIYQIFHSDKIFFHGDLFPLENKKQKTMEQLIGHCRKEQIDAKELIQIYGDYRREHRMRHKKEEQALLSTLLLHNHDDLYGLILICPLLGYSLLFAGKFTNFTLETCRFTEKKDLYKRNLDCLLELTITTPFTFLPIHGFYPVNGTLSLHTISLLIPGRFTELKFFFPDYKNYYYLPEEDMAVHKSIASFVDKKRRCKAKPDTCYRKKRGYFFPQPAIQPVFQPAFYEKYRGENAWFEWTEKLMEQKEMMTKYAIAYFIFK